MFTKKTMLGIGLAGAIGFGTSVAVEAAVINSYFGMNFGNSYAEVSEVELLSITYSNGSGTFSVAMPVFTGASNFFGQPYVGMPDGNDSQYFGGPTYTTVAGGNGETTRTVGTTIPIDWDMTNPMIPTISILSVDVKAIGAVWTVTAIASGGYTVGLIPVNPAGYSELSGFPGFAPQDDIYGNPVGFFVATAVTPGFNLEPLLGTAFGTFQFAAAAVPVPAAVWLFGSGLLGLIGVARRK